MQGSSPRTHGHLKAVLMGSGGAGVRVQGARSTLTHGSNRRCGKEGERAHLLSALRRVTGGRYFRCIRLGQIRGISGGDQ